MEQETSTGSKIKDNFIDVLKYHGYAEVAYLNRDQNFFERPGYISSGVDFTKEYLELYPSLGYNSSLGYNHALDELLGIKIRSKGILNVKFLSIAEYPDWNRSLDKRKLSDVVWVSLSPKKQGICDRFGYLPEGLSIEEVNETPHRGFTLYRSKFDWSKELSEPIEIKAEENKGVVPLYIVKTI